MWGVAPIASPTVQAVGLTAYGCDSLPTYTAPIFSGSTFLRFRAFLAASTAIVAASSSRSGTDFSNTPSPPVISEAFAPQTFVISSTFIRYLGIYAP